MFRKIKIFLKKNYYLAPRVNTILGSWHKQRFSLLVEWTNNCNICCNICPIERPSLRAKGHMEIDLWKKILDDCKKNGHYVMYAHHLGEPLIWKNFAEGMKLWHDSGLSVKGRLSTNGILLDESKAKIIEQAKLEYLIISLDTLRPEVYRKLRNNDNHSLIISNIKIVLEKYPSINVLLQFMHTNLNEDETPEDFFNFFGRKYNYRVFHTTLMNVGKKHDFSLLKEEKLDPRFCSKLDYEHCVIGWDGTVGLCCFDYPLLNKIGNIKDKSILQIFNGLYANKMRNMIRHGDFSLSAACQYCSYDHMKCQKRDIVGSKRELYA